MSLPACFRRGHRGAVLVPVMVLAFLLGGCGDDGDSGSPEPSPKGGSSTTGADTGSGAKSDPAGITFTDVSETSGIDVVNVSGDVKQKLAIPENIGQGAAALDYDGDGLLDLFIANGDAFPGTERAGDGRCGLFRNLGGMKFEDVTEKAGLVFDAWCHGANAVDFDADGHPDLYVTVYLGTNRFFRNLGDGRFEDVSERWGARDPGPSTASAFFDADGDGDLDLYVGNYVHYDPENPPNNGQPCEWKQLQVSCGPRGTKAAADTFWVNEDGALQEATKRFGFGGVDAAYTLGAVTGDFDNDDDVDLYVANDSVANYLFVNDGKGGFSEEALLYGVDMSESGSPQAGMGVDFGDVDNDGRFEYFVTHFSHDHNTIYHNILTDAGTTMFTDASYVMKLGESSFSYLSWGARILDFDQDGWQDIAVASGHVYPQVDGAKRGTRYAQPNQIFRNTGPNERGVVGFEDLAKSAGSGFAKKAVSRGLVTADFDEDGDADIFIVELDTTPTLLRNDTKRRGHWVGLLLRGKGGNRDAIGARVVVEDSAGQARHAERCSGQSYLSSCDPRILMGLGEAAGPLKKLTVRWPGGATQTFEGLAVDRYWSIEEGRDEATPLGSR